MKAHLIIILLLLLGFGAGCSSDLPAIEVGEASVPVESGTAFDALRAGRVSGRVMWSGAIPNPPGFLYGVPRFSGNGFEFRTAENPNRPRIDTATRAVEEAVVFLRGVDPAAGRAWDLPQVSVEIGNARISVVQGERRGRVGFVRRGDTLTAASTEAAYHVLRGRGDAFFSLPFPEPNQPVQRKLPKAGLVELTSGTGLYWANANLFVSDHPYFTVTDAEGHFTFDRVPAGPVEVVVWLPGWKAAKTERDADSTQVARQKYSAPIERGRNVVIKSSQTAEVNVTVP